MNPAKALWKKRLAAHIRTNARYTVYAGQSGFFLFVLAVFLASSYMYGKVLERLPDTFPHALVITCIVTPFLALSPIRTLLREADLIFLVPMEARIGPYFRGALRYSFLTQSFAVLLAVFAVMPLHRHGFGTDAAAPFAVLAFALALKFANLLAAWLESSFVRAGYRALFRLARWLADAAVVYALYRFGLIAGLIAFAAASAIMGLWAFRTRKLVVNWTYLRLMENRHRTTLLLFFNSFVDVDELPNRVKPRRLLARLAKRIPLRQPNVFLYLYLLTLLRSELFGILCRLTLVAAAILLCLSTPGLYAIVYALFFIVTSVQLTTLSRFHRHSVWPALYPVPSALRRDSAVRVALGVRLVQAVILLLPALRPVVFTPWLLLLPIAAALVAYSSTMRAIRTGHRGGLK